MRAIYAGVKALDWDTAASAGEEVVRELLATHRDIDGIVAGCTEIPRILGLVNRSGSADLRRRLSRIEVVDPVELALNTARGRVGAV